MITVRLENADQAEFVQAIYPAGITQDGDTLTLTEVALARLAEQSPELDGHYDGNAVWMQGIDYPVERSEDDQPHTPDVERVVGRIGSWLTGVSGRTDGDLTGLERGRMEAYADALHAASQDDYFLSQFFAADDRLAVLREQVERMSAAWRDWCAQDAR